MYNTYICTPTQTNVHIEKFCVLYLHLKYSDFRNIIIKLLSEKKMDLSKNVKTTLILHLWT